MVLSFRHAHATASPAVFDPNLVTKGKKVPTDYFFFSLFFSLSFAFDPM